MKIALFLAMTFSIGISNYALAAEGCRKTLPNDHYEIKSINEGNESTMLKRLEDTFYAQVDGNAGSFIVNHYYYNSFQQKFMVGAQMPVAANGQFTMANWKLQLTEAGCLEIVESLIPHNQ